MSHMFSAMAAQVELMSGCWALRPELLQGLLNAVPGQAMHFSAEPPAAGARRPAAPTVRTAPAGSGGRIAVLPLHGLLMQRPGLLLSIYGGTSTMVFKEALREVLADPGVDSVLIEIDSPGGSVYGAQELAEEILRGRAVKPIVALADSLCASAAYWIGSSASQFYVTPGGEAGSIGVYSAHTDVSEAMVKKGFKVSLIAAGKYKTEGNAFEPLPTEARAFMQETVDRYYSTFVRQVAKGRGVPVDAVRQGMGKGRCLGAEAAVQRGMADGVQTLNATLRMMSQTGFARPNRSAAPPSARLMGLKAKANGAEHSLSRCERLIQILEAE